jgi:hypothetical protein
MKQEICYSIAVVAPTQEAKYLESWPSTTSAWAGWSRFDISMDRYSGVHSLLICTSSTLESPTCHQASQQDNTNRAKYQKAGQRQHSVYSVAPTIIYRRAAFFSALGKCGYFPSCISG